VLKLILLFLIKKSAILVLASSSVNDFNKINKNINIKIIFCDLSNLTLKNKQKVNNKINPAYKVKLGLTKQINKKKITTKKLINLLYLEINNK
jgi:hypothetical protein